MIIDYKWKDVKMDIQKSVERYFFDQLAEAEKIKQDRLNKQKNFSGKKIKIHDMGFGQ